MGAFTYQPRQPWAGKWKQRNESGGPGGFQDPPSQTKGLCGKTLPLDGIVWSLVKMVRRAYANNKNPPPNIWIWDMITRPNGAESQGRHPNLSAATWIQIGTWSMFLRVFQRHRPLAGCWLNIMSEMNHIRRFTNEVHFFLKRLSWPGLKDKWP